MTSLTVFTKSKEPTAWAVLALANYIEAEYTTAANLSVSFQSDEATHACELKSQGSASGLVLASAIVSDCDIVELPARASFLLFDH